MWGYISLEVRASHVDGNIFCVEGLKACLLVHHIREHTYVSSSLSGNRVGLFPCSITTYRHLLKDIKVRSRFLLKTQPVRVVRDEG